jgi:hypothetical protein
VARPARFARCCSPPPKRAWPPSRFLVETAQRAEVEHLTGQLARLRDTLTTVLALAEQLKATTIEAILAKSDLELGLEFLLRRGRLDEDADG